jgi:hypothetical protein
MPRKRAKKSGTSARTCDKCQLQHPSTVEGTKHRRCGGKPGAPIRPKHSVADIRGTWR